MKVKKGRNDRIAPPPGEGLGIKIAAGETGHLFQTHFPAQGGNRMDNHQAANAFLQLCPYRPALFGNRARNGRLISFAPLCSASGSGRNADVQSPFPEWFFFFQFSIFIGGFHQRQLGLLVADGVETIAQTLDFILFDSFHGDLIC